MSDRRNRRRPQLGLEQLEERAVPGRHQRQQPGRRSQPRPRRRHAPLRHPAGRHRAPDTTNTINLTLSGDYKITLPGTPGETDNAAGEFAITPNAGNLTIINASGGQVTVDGNHLARVFDINPNFDPANPTPKFLVTLQGFTIANGVAVDPANLDGPTSSGGGVRDQRQRQPDPEQRDHHRQHGHAPTAAACRWRTRSASRGRSRSTTASSATTTPATRAAASRPTARARSSSTAGTVITGNTCNNQGGGIWLDATMDGVGSVLLTNPGGGYVTAPTVTFGAPQLAGGTTATGIAVITGGAVTGVTITNPGSGYSAAPAVTFSAPPAGATANGIVNLDFFNSANLTVTGTLISDNAALNTGANDGGGVGNAGDGTVKILSSTIEYNSTGGIGGGYGFFHGQATGALQVFDSLFLGNYAAGGGGGIAAGGTSTLIVSSLVQGNSTAGAGGGVSASGGQLLIENSAIAGNASQASGGGVEIETTGTGADASEIVNTTIAYNSAVNSAGGQIGGGIDIGSAGGFTGALTLLSDTINANYAITGGGVANASTVLVAVQNTIIAGNNATNTGPDYDGTNGVFFTSLGGNLIGTNNGDTTFNQTTDQVGTPANPLNPLLGPLQDNGGPTVGSPGASVVLYTEAIGRGSLALGKGVAAGAPSVDARGFARPDVAGEAVDVGAYEFQAGAPNVVFYVGTDNSLHEVGPAGNVTLSGPDTILSASAVTDNAGNDDVYAITSFGHQLWEHTVAGWAQISAGSFQQITAATNRDGYAEVFAVGTDNSLTVFTPAGADAAVSGRDDPVDQRRHRRRRQRRRVRDHGRPPPVGTHAGRLAAPLGRLVPAGKPV